MQHETTHTPDQTEAERRDVQIHAAVGIAIGTLATAGLAGYIITHPDEVGSALLAAAILAGVALIAWVHRCGGRHEHHRLEVLLVEQRDRIEALDEAIGDLGEAVEDDRRQAQTGRARVRIAEAMSHLDGLRPPPAGGIDLEAYRNRRDRKDYQ